MTHADLIARLRRLSPSLDILSCEVVLQAADALEAQAEENRRLREALRPFASAWGIAQASGLTDMSRLGALARNETASVYFMRARAALSSTGEKG